MGQSEPELQQLHTASVDLDRLARAALEGHDAASRGALVESMDHWVQLVEGMVGRCPPGEALAHYRAATAQLELSLGQLNRAANSEEVAQLGLDLPLVVERWSQALTEVLGQVVRGL